MALSLTPLSLRVSSSMSLRTSLSGASGNSMTWEVDRCCESVSAMGGRPQSSRMLWRWLLSSSVVTSPSSWRSMDSSRRIRTRPKLLLSSVSLSRRLPASTANTRRTGGCSRSGRSMERDRLTLLLGCRLVVNEVLARVRQDGCGHENQQVARPVHFRPAPEQRADNRDVSEHRHGFNKGALIAFQYAAHRDGLTGFHNDARGEFLGAVLREVDVKCAGGQT